MESQPLCRRIDHVFVVTDGLTAAPEQLFDVFNGRLGLPAVFPMTRFGSMATGMVSLGNLAVEIVGLPDLDDRNRRVAPGEDVLGWYLPGWKEWAVARRQRGFGRARIDGVGLDADEGNATIPELDRRGLAHSPEITGPIGFRDVLVHDLLAEAGIAFLSYKQVFTSRYDDWAKAGGGALGVVEVSEIAIRVSDVHARHRAWARLMAPLEPLDRGVWHFGPGPDLRLVEENSAEFFDLTLRVGDLDAARRLMDNNGLTVGHGGGEVLIDFERVLGLTIRVVAA